IIVAALLFECFFDPKLLILTPIINLNEFPYGIKKNDSYRICRLIRYCHYAHGRCLCILQIYITWIIYNYMARICKRYQEPVEGEPFPRS
ncbi:unnamed protein product, partial [Amoebophrya sp. A25]